MSILHTSSPAPLLFARGGVLLPHAAVTMSPLGYCLPATHRSAICAHANFHPDGKLPSDFDHVILMSNLTIQAF